MSFSKSLVATWKSLWFTHFGWLSYGQPYHIALFYTEYLKKLLIYVLIICISLLILFCDIMHSNGRQRFFRNHYQVYLQMKGYLINKLLKPGWCVWWYVWIPAWLILFVLIISLNSILVSIALLYKSIFLQLSVTDHNKELFLSN